MLVYLIRRLGQSLLVVAVMATLVFVALFAVGDPVDILASPDADQIERDAIASRLGLDRPLWEQFGLFVWRALHGDLGRSFVYNVPAVDVILQRLPATLELALVGLVFSIAIGIPLGVVAGLKPHSAAGRSIMSGSMLGFSLPNFWIGLMLILLFAPSSASTTRQDGSPPARSCSTAPSCSAGRKRSCAASARSIPTPAA